MSTKKPRVDDDDERIFARLPGRVLVGDVVVVEYDRDVVGRAEALAHACATLERLGWTSSMSDDALRAALGGC